MSVLLRLRIASDSSSRRLTGFLLLAMALHWVALFMLHSRVTRVTVTSHRNGTMLCANAVAAHQCKVKHQEHRQERERAPH
jgi:hypothetical protein